MYPVFPKKLLLVGTATTAVDYALELAVLAGTGRPLHPGLSFAFIVLVTYLVGIFVMFAVTRSEMRKLVPDFDGLSPRDACGMFGRFQFGVLAWVALEYGCLGLFLSYEDIAFINCCVAMTLPKHSLASVRPVAT